MPDNIDEKHSGNPIDNLSENPSEEIISTINPETINTNQESVDMEIHKHPHHVTHKKKWGEYLLEFLMLFLAVFLGFVAENIREHMVERAREKEYMLSLIEDLKYDTLKYQKVITDVEILRPAMDSSYVNIKEASRFNYILQGNGSLQ